MMRRVAAVWTAIFALGGSAWAAGPQVYTPQATYLGLSETSGVSVFAGIPYAQPPVGPLRWAQPRAVAASAAVQNATDFGAACPQEGSSHPTAESCLFLNVYTPASATLQPTATPLGVNSSLPVMVWIHGGSLTTGSGEDYDGSLFASQGNVIIVTINYRLGILGFLAQAGLAAQDPDGSSGNYGMQDQQFALGWVRDNIAAFGGDPGRVTMFGESAGGFSTQNLLTSPNTPALHGAIVQSGAYNDAIPTLAASEATGNQIATQKLGCHGTSAQIATCLRGLSAQYVLRFGQELNPSYVPTPDVDLYTFPQEPLTAFSTGAFQHVPLISGSNHDEYNFFQVLEDDLFVPPYTDASYRSALQAEFGVAVGNQVYQLYPTANYPNPNPKAYPSWRSANYAYSAVQTDLIFACNAHLVDSLAAQYVPVYSYEFSDNQPPPLLPADKYMPLQQDEHASELAYFWQDYAPLKPAQTVLSTAMIAYWSSFAGALVPAAPGGPTWRSFNATGGALSLSVPMPAMTAGFYAFHHCDFWKPFILLEAGLPPGSPY